MSVRSDFSSDTALAVCRLGSGPSELYMGDPRLVNWFARKPWIRVERTRWRMRCMRRTHWSYHAGRIYAWKAPLGSTWQKRWFVYDEFDLYVVATPKSKDGKLLIKSRWLEDNVHARIDFYKHTGRNVEAAVLLTMLACVRRISDDVDIRAGCSPRT